ncbi:MAG: IS66 family transposase [Chloroflexi bacterium]|nr:IS66 family transposase [Chloroflexota bacterium]MBU1748921.1 IS66 family transposase [Chloroflexota bacterium]
MCERARPDSISTEDWAATPLVVQELVLSLYASVQHLTLRITDLEERQHQTSRNSSKPPSSDPPDAPRRAQRTPSGRKRGGQQGHKGHGRQLKPPAAVTRIVDVKPVCCADCGALLLGADVQPARHQVTELPRVEPEVVEYRQHTLTCLACGRPTTPAWPAEMPSGSFGPRVQATVGYLTGRMSVSHRDVEEAMAALFHTDLALGSVPALEQQVSAALAQPVEAAQAYVQEQPVVNADETSWQERKQRRWLWIGTTPRVTVFLVLATRGAVSAQQLVGLNFQGIVGSDRWSGYNWLPVWQRQLCWAHLTRDFQALVDRGGASAPLGAALLKQVKTMFELWHHLRAGTLLRLEFQEQMAPIREQVGALLREGTVLSHDKTRRTCENILKLESALWTFVFWEGVEPTNNGAERPLRRAVLWRRRSFGTQSETGSLFVGRVLTTVTTLRQQQRDVLDYLTEACAAAIRGDIPPSLLPGL